MTKFGIGQAITRREDQRLLTGTGQYVDDTSAQRRDAPGAGALAPRARTHRVHRHAGRQGDARRHRRVHRGRSAGGRCRRLPHLCAGLMNAEGKPMTAPPYYPLAVGEVRFVGEAVAAVVAQTRLQAQDAAEQVAVEYEELPTVVTIEAATAKNAPQLWPDAPGNIAAQTEFGDKKATDAAFAKAKHVTKLSFYNQRLVPVSMEPRGSAAEFDQASGRITLLHQLPEPGRAAEDAGGRHPQGADGQGAGARGRCRRRLRHEDHALSRGRGVRLRRAQARTPGVLARHAQRRVPRRHAWPRPEQRGRAGVRRRRQDPGLPREHRRQRRAPTAAARAP